MKTPNIRLPGILAACLVMLAACAPQQNSTTSAGSSSNAPDPQTRAPKILTIGVLRESAPFMMTSASSGPGGSAVGKGIAHDLLTIETDSGPFDPQLAAEQISLERGTWTINPDGTMDTTWKLRPNIKWHDGTPFTSADMLFSAIANNDKNLPVRRDPGVELMQLVDAPDPYTLHIRWSGILVDANKAPGLTPMPKHLLEELYKTDRDAFVNSAYFTTQFVGLGPYRLVKWEQGSHLEFTRFDDYYRGRPPLDTVYVRFLGDPNTMVANILSGQVDVLVSTGVDLDAALELRKRWEGTGNQVRPDFTGGIEQFSMQHRVEYARPRNALTNRLVRQALVHALDRQALTDAMTQGLAPVADGWFRPGQALWADVESSIPRYPYDVSRAQQLLTDAGWVRGRDGVLVHQATGERFEQGIWTQGTTIGGERMISIIADYWKAVGVQPSLELIPTARQGDREYEATLPGPHTIGGNAENLYINRLNSRYLAGPENRWNEKNKGGYVNPRLDTPSDLIQITIDPAERIRLHRQILEEGMGDVAQMLFYWQIVPTIMRAGVKTHPVAPNLETWDFFYWDKA